jgi:hypothetical protein
VKQADCLLSGHPAEGPLQALVRFDANDVVALAGNRLAVEEAVSWAPACRSHETTSPATLLRQLGEHFWRVQMRDPMRGVVGELRDPTAALLVFFGGLDPTTSPPKYDWKGLGLDVPQSILVRDHAQVWYQAGIAQLGASVDQSARSLAALIEAIAPPRVAFIGNSAGGYGALLYGSLLGVDAVHVFSPQTFLTPSVRRDLGETRWAENVERLHRLLPDDPTSFDLARALRRNQAPAVIHYAADDPLDTLHAHRLAACDNVELRAHPEGGHDLVVVLKERGQLRSLLDEAMTGGRLRQLAA